MIFMGFAMIVAHGYDQEFEDRFDFFLFHKQSKVSRPLLTFLGTSSV